MHPTISEALAKSRQQQFRREADQWRLARRARSRAGGDRPRPGPFAAAVAGLAAGLAAWDRQLPPRRPVGGPAQARLMRLPQRGNAPSLATGDFMPAGPWIRRAPLRAPASRCPPGAGGVPALPGDDAGLFGAQARWDAHRPVDTPPAPGRGTARAVRDISCRCCFRRGA